VTDPWAEVEAEHERAADAAPADFALAIDSVPPDATTGPAAVAVTGAEAVADTSLDFADIHASADPLMPEPVTAEQAQAAAAVFDLSSFDGMVEDAPPPPPRQPVILESEDEPVVTGSLAEAAPAAAAGEETPSTFEVGGLVEEPAAAPAARPARAPRPTPAATAASEKAAAAIARPVTKPAQPSGKGSLVMALLIFAVLIAVGLAWFDVVRIPWLSDFIAARRPAPTSLAPTPGAPAPAPDVLAASLALGAFTAPPLARLQAESLSGQRPELLFVVAPVRIAGVVYHRLLAGPARDAAEAAGLRRRLAALLTREDPASWPLQSTPLAFALGDTDDLAAARARADALSRVDIPAYVLELPAPSAASPLVWMSAHNVGARYRVYAGAYADANEAAYLADLLARQGETQARLIARTGRHIE
jgi:hypothetical protein